jgi:hypothetical protein
MAKTRLFGESISPEVIKQLERRAEILSRGVRNSNDLRYLNEKTTWIRAISGVNTVNEVEKFTSEEAKNFILSGGELKWDGKRFVRRRGFNVGDSNEERGRYNHDKDLGIRPEAGITSFDIKHIGTYGALREANLTFNVWTRSDLEKTQNLFLRPGMSIIVEWGNSIFLDGNGNVKDTLNFVDQEKFFINNSFNNISNILQENRENNFFNCDGFLGYITNFSWTFRPDGGYDCSIKVISRGAVLESLSVYKPLDKVILELDGTVQTELTANISNSINKTYMHYVLQLLDQIPIANSDFRGKAKAEEISSNLYAPLATELGLDPKEVETDVFYKITFTERPKTNADTEFKRETYVNLKTLLALFNIAFQFRVPSGDRITSFYVENKEEIIEPSYVSFSQHFSLDPLYCLLPKKATFTDSNGTSYSLEVGNITERIAIREQNNIDKISSIYVNLNEIVGDLTKFLEGEKEPNRVNLYDFLKGILNKLNSKLGYINNFDLSYDEVLEKWFIVDRNCVFPKLSNENTDTNSSRTVARLNITGLKSTVSDIKLSTVITPELTSQIAISAQAENINDVNVNLPIAEWNSNVVDRFTFSEILRENPTATLDDAVTERIVEQPTKTEQRSTINGGQGTIVVGTNSNAEEDIRKIIDRKKQEKISLRDKYFKLVGEAYDLISLAQTKITELRTPQGTGATVATIVNQEFNYRVDLYEKLKADSYVRFKNAVYGTGVEGADTISNSGLIPITLEIKVDGISGLKIGQIFRLGDLNNSSNILPSVYDLYGFIITGVDSLIENNKWFTTIRGLTFRLENTGINPTGKL